MKFVKHIKIRIAEPLTCVTTGEKGIAFGSISGYVGFYSKSKQEVTYVKEVFEEIIRTIQFINPDMAYACVGDESGLVLNFREANNIQHESIQYTRNHNLSQCPNTIPFLNRETCLLVPFPSTSNKETQIESYYKQSAWLLNYDTRSQIDLGKITIASYSVPFCFNGKRLLWLEFHENKEKNFMVYDITKQDVEKLYTFPHKSKYDQISHARWYNDNIIFVKNGKIVEMMDLHTNKITTLYEHKSHIVAFEILYNQSTPITPNSDKNVYLNNGDKQEEEKLSDMESRGISGGLQVFSIDYTEKLCIYQDHKVSQVIDLRKLPDFPKLPSNTYLFDMGYPYFISVDSKNFSFTSDQGLFILERNQ